MPDWRHDDELAASRHPFETYLLVLAALSGIPLLFGAPNSASVEAALPPLLVAVWGAMLVVGSTMALVGTYWRGRLMTSYVLERTGLVGVGGASVVYALCAVMGAGLDAAFSACLTVGFGVACFAQAHRISRRVGAILNRVERLRRLDREDDA